LELATYDAAYVENLLLAERRRRQLPTPTLLTPKRRELLDEAASKGTSVPEVLAMLIGVHPRAFSSGRFVRPRVQYGPRP
jgi:hypothetical protein